MPKTVRLKPVIEEIKNPPEPLELFNAINARPYCFFLDSACDHKKLGRYSFLGCDPFLVFRSKGDAVTLEWVDGKTEQIRSNPFTVLKQLLKKYDMPPGNYELPFVGGAVGYFSYDLKNFIEDLPDRALDDLRIPDCILGFYDNIIAFDNLERRCYAVSNESADSKRRSKDFAARLSDGRTRDEDPGSAHPPKLRSNFSKPSYIRAVEKAKSYIKKGDIYQVNLSQRFEASVDIRPAELYRRLRAASPAPFSSYLDFKDVAIVSSSPERFLLKRGNYIETRPIKGTRPRGEDLFSDMAMEKELLTSRKDAAEHIMIVDLERNDLGRICEYGSVRPTESSVLEKYANVFHLVSTVSGKLKKGVDCVDCIGATFPGGSITGAPKIRSMEIIEELEPVKRSIYTGAIGYISFNGNMDTSIVIRTFLVKDKKAYFQVGGGIVADSDPEKEYEETLHKARGLMQALGVESAPHLIMEGAGAGKEGAG